MCRAIEQLRSIPYDPEEIDEAKNYIAKKLSIGRDELERIMRLPPKWYWDYPNDERRLSFIYETYRKTFSERKIRPVLERQMPKSVSVVIPTYNYGRFIKTAIGSVLDQTRSPAEIVVVDDGSTDETAAVVAAFGKAVRYIRQDNAGVCAARNRGVSESTGELIAFLDADDTMEPSNLEKQVARFESDDEIGLVHCAMREFDRRDWRNDSSAYERRRSPRG